LPKPLRRNPRSRRYVLFQKIVENGGNLQATLLDAISHAETSWVTTTSAKPVM
jgi:uncharacterized phage-associated protein